MKRFLPAILIVLFLCTLAFGQNPESTKFGHITQAEIALQQSPKYSKASAVVLDDVGTSRFLLDDDGKITIVFERRTRIKIFTEAGFSYAKIVIPFQNGYGVEESIEQIEAVTYNYEHGHLVETRLSPKNIYRENGGVRNYVKFVLPNVKKGSIIEYRYRLETNSLFRLPSWNFQTTIPVLYSEYRVRMIPFFQYTWLLQGSDHFDYHKSYEDQSYERSFLNIKYNDYVHDFVMTNVPAFVDEHYIASEYDYLIKLNFQLSKEIYPDGAVIKVINTWSSLIRDRLADEDFGKYVRKSVKLSSKLMDMKKLSKEPEEKRFNDVINYMKSHFVWNGDENSFATQKPNVFVAGRSGSSQEINLFTVGMLRAAGIDAYPVLISTRAHGVVKYIYPYLHFFNNVIILANVNGKQVLSDASARNCLNNRIPIRCINGKGLIIKKSDNVQWVRLDKTPLSETVIINNITFLNKKIMLQNHKTILKNELRNSLGIMATEYDALRYRNDFPKDPNVLRKRLESNSYDLLDSTLSVKNLHNRNKPYILSYSYKMQPTGFDNPSSVTAGKIYVAPFFNELMKKNMFTQDSRTFPIDLIYPHKKELTTTVTIPSGYRVEYIPKSVDIDNELYQLKYGVMQNGSKLTITLEYYFKKGIYPASDYGRLKSFFAQVIKKGNDNIVLVRKN